MRENLLRPSHYLGYDRDQLGVYFVERGAMELAESQFRRAVWLNPYEPVFKVHWAGALLALGQMEEARSLIQDVLKEHPENPDALRFWRQYWPGRALPGEASDGGKRES
jgi:Flp pilus assembly protein TadD